MDVFANGYNEYHNIPFWHIIEIGWDSMEIRTLRYFLAVAREENMSRAAEILHVTQPTLSKQLKSLEEELGKKLFTRHSFSIKLTDEGLLLRNRAEDLVRMADKIEQEYPVDVDDLRDRDSFASFKEYKKYIESDEAADFVYGDLCDTSNPSLSKAFSWVVVGCPKEL